MCGYFCIEFIDFMLKGKNLLDYTNLSSPNDYEKITNTKIFSMIKKMKKIYCAICANIILLKKLVLSIICSECKNEDEKLFKEEESIEILKILGLIENI